ncbi:MAG TPA: branched-chain-amino-acid transaminase [Allosphingosinicella sp.]|nr:branched-chain-amino-acid transaminase [Allosphingosinicella sp.]
MVSGYDPSGLVWFNGEMLPWSSARLHLMSKGLQYSVSVFEGLRAYDGTLGLAIFRLQDHTRRLLRSAEVLGIDLPYSEQMLCDAQLQVVAEAGECYLRPTVFLGSGEPGLSCSADVQVAIAAWPWPLQMGGREAKLVLSSYRRTFAGRDLAFAKASANYMPARLALREAKAAGFDDAVLLDESGLVSEATTSNIFVVQGGCVRTPSPGSALDGITRSTLITILRGHGIRVEECELTPSDLREADEVFLSGTACEVLPVSRFEDRELPGSAGAMVCTAMAAYSAAVRGRSNLAEEWLTPCRPASDRTADLASCRVHQADAPAPQPLTIS